MLSIDIHVLDHTLGYYRLHRTLTPEQETSTIDVPVRIQINWNRLAHLIRQYLGLVPRRPAQQPPLPRSCC